MRLLSHNVLRNTAKDVIEGFPLKIEATKVDVRDSECDMEFLRHLLPSLSWKGLKSAARDLGLDASVLPDEATAAAAAQDEEFLRALHKTLFDVHVLEGALVCPETGRRFPITGGVPNMMLEDAELS